MTKLKAKGVTLPSARDMDAEAKRVAAKNAAQSGPVVSYRKGDPKPVLPPGEYDYDEEGDRW